MVGHALRRLVAGDLHGLLDGPSTVAFDPTLPMISLDLSRVAENSTLVSVLMTYLLLGVDGGRAAGPCGRPAVGDLRRGVAPDVASGAAAADGCQWRLSRHYGIANMLVFHKLTDLDNVGDQGSAMRSLASSLLANAETRIVYRQALSVKVERVGHTG
ncbi:hypothetical protein [Streptomyces nodosus]|uniref:hypothetical protein n=1 Tax=Streptomyces nodosus TaxID=40318 RepID=UPI003815266C